VNKFVLKLDKEEAHALVDAFIRSLDNTKRSTPAEIRMIDKLTELGEMLEDEA
jgi:hypothetical protein